MRQHVKRVLKIVVCLTAISVAARAAHAERDIVYSARYYLKPGQKGVSRYHLYRINADGSRRTQITRGAHDDELPMWAKNGQHIIFVRDANDLMSSDENGGHLTKMQDLKGADWDGLKLSPDGKSIGFIQHVATAKGYVDALRLLNLGTKKVSQIADVEYYAWSPDNRYLALNSAKSGFRVLDLRTRAVRKIVIEKLGRFAWISPTDFAATIQKTSTNDDNTSFNLGVESIQIHNLSRAVQTFKIATTDDELLDWRSFVRPIPHANNAFTLVVDESTSSGYEAMYFRVSTISGRRTRLAEGQSFAWSPSGNLFAVVSYHDTTPYDTLPNGHKRVVYTTKLQVGTGEKDLKTLVSGTVLVRSADWRRTPKK